MPAKEPSQGDVEPAYQDGHRVREEDVLLGSIPQSPRLRRLLRDLETLMISEGFLNLSTDDIAQRLRCSKTSLYRLGRTRDDLFELVIRLWLARLRDAGWDAYDDASDPRAKVVGFLSAAEIATRRNFTFMRDMQGFPAGQRALEEHAERRIADLEQIISERIKSNAFHDIHPRLAADLIFTTMRRLVEPELLASVGLSIQDAIDEAVRIFENGLIRPRKPKGRKSKTTS